MEGTFQNISSLIEYKYVCLLSVTARNNFTVDLTARMNSTEIDCSQFKWQHNNCTHFVDR